MAAVNSEDRLQQYFDGELPDDEMEDVRRELASDEALRAKRDGLAHLSTLISVGAEEMAKDLDADALFASIRARLAEDIHDDDPMFPQAPTAQVATGQAAPPEAAETRPALRVLAGGKTAEPTLSSAPRSRRGVFIALTVTALAAAAALAFFFTRPGAGLPGDERSPIAALEPPPGSEVEEVDFGFSTGAIFTVEGQQGEQYAVVWISDEKIENEEQEERLQ